MCTRGEGLIILLGTTQATLLRNIIEPMRANWGERMVGNVRSDNSIYLFGKKAYLLGADNRGSVSKIQGATIEYAYGDEVATWSQNVFEMLKSRLRCEHSVFDGTCNPEGPDHWFKKFIDSDADIYRQDYVIDDNPYLPQDFVKSLKNEYKGTVYYDRYILGKWALAEGIIYSMFNKKRHVKPITEIAPLLLEGRQNRFVSCDYGTQNATVFLLWNKGIDGVWYCTREYYYSGRDKGKQKTDTEYADDLIKWLDGTKIRAMIVDPSAASFIAELNQRGIQVQKGDNDVLDGIRTVATLLNQGRIVFSDTCVNTIAEFGTYVWDEKASQMGEDRPIKLDDHAMDAVRYFCYTIFAHRRANLIVG